MEIYTSNSYFKEYSGWNGIYKAVEFAPGGRHSPISRGKAEVVVKFSLDEQRE